MNFWEILAQKHREFIAFAEEFRRLHASSEPLRSLFSSIERMLSILTDLENAPEQVTADRFVKAAKRLQKDQNNYLSYLRKHRPSPEEAELASKALPVIRQFLTADAKPLRESIAAMVDGLNEVEELNMDRVSERGRTSIQTKPQDYTIAKNTPTQCFGQLLWVGELEALAERTNQRTQLFLDSEAYQKKQRLLHELERAEAATQTRYARLMAMRERQLTQVLTDTYNTLLSRYADQPDSHHKALQALVIDKSYLNAQNFFAFKAELMQGPLERPLRYCTSRFVPRQAAADAAALLNGDTERRLRTTRSGTEALQNADQNALEAMKSSGLPMNEFARNVYALSRRIAADPDRSASEFYSIARQLALLEKQNHENPGDPLYQKRLRACEFTARAYLQHHREVPFSPKGKRRVAIARDVLQLCTQRLHATAPRTEEVAPDRAAELEQLQNKSANELAELARYQSRIGTARIDPPVPAPRSEVGDRKDDEQRRFGHHLYNFFVGVAQISTALPTNLVGAGMWVWDRVWGKKKHSAPAAFEAEHVPGLAGEKYKEPEPGKIITDKRRIPLVFETPIPEDPNQPITLSFEVDQPYEGSDVGSNWTATKVGHAFLTLKYSKINPLTGKMERFRTSFGFYPKKLGPIMTVGSATIGTKVQGAIHDDCAHAVSVGSTVTITPQQFNDIIRFTGEYEKGGYNMIDRNCTDFAIDAIRHAGIKLPELEKVERVSLTNKGFLLGAAMTVSDMFQGHLLTHVLTKRRMKDAADKADITQYSRIGQNMASSEDVERMKDSHLKYNLRLKGYAPGETAEAIRGSYSFELHSSKYFGTKETRRAAFDALPENERKQEYDRSKLSSASETDEMLEKDRHTFLVNLMRQEVPRLRRKIEAVYGKKNPEINAVIERLGRFQQTAIDAIEKYTQAGIDCISQGLLPLTSKEIQVALRDGTKHMNNYIQELNTIFHDVFKSDSRLNIPFQNTVSLIERLREEFYSVYASSQKFEDVVFPLDPLLSFEETDNKNITTAKKLEKQIIDQTRNVSHALWLADHVSCSYGLINPKNNRPSSFEATPRQVLALMMMSDAPNDLAWELTKVQKNHSIKNAFDAMCNALDTMHDGHEFSDAELKAVFTRLPKLERSKGVLVPSPSKIYQAFALEAILGKNFLDGIHDIFTADCNAYPDPLFPTEDISELANHIEMLQLQLEQPEQLSVQERQQLEATLADLMQKYDQNDPDKLRANEDSFAQAFCRKVLDHLDKKLEALPPEKKEKLNHVVDIIADGMMEQMQNPIPEARARCVAQAKEYLTESIRTGYLNYACQKEYLTLSDDIMTSFAMPSLAASTDAIMMTDKWKPTMLQQQRIRSHSVAHAAPKAEVQPIHRSNSIAGPH